MVFWQLVRQPAIPKHGINSHRKGRGKVWAVIFRRKMFGIPKGLTLTRRRDVATFAKGLVLVASARQNQNAVIPKFMASPGTKIGKVWCDEMK